ncbi:glycosyltransferase family 8 protein [Anoxybacterium hadale]|uniref:Glycosyltransferase family 8 protein n=2 Tax=Anoxybacterium hadale TaxID=3408580 RepID=A0ACD1AI50_9FIRM|nr:glycosyltransferase family 8 protein [Clostridiales bacterium]
MKSQINILVTLDSNYLKPLRVMLKSMFLNNADEVFQIYVLHTSLKEEEITELESFVSAHHSCLVVIRVSDDWFQDAPVLFHYTREMYFRLLAHQLLPQDLDRILYLDPDILVLNSVRKLYNTNMEGFLYAAAFHDKISVREINRVRLLPYEIESYYNSGVLLMNLAQLRKEADEREIFRFVEENRAKLVMPDQDILNALYAKQIKSLDELYYNYDARYYIYYKLTTNGSFDMDRVINETVFLHFCGKKKPWSKKYSGVFHALYKHYERQMLLPMQPHLWPSE